MGNTCFWKSFREKILNDKIIAFSALFVTILSFGFTITHYSMGIDDPARIHYFLSSEYGNMIQQGRLLHVVLNYLTDAIDFIPFFSDFLGACLFCLSALLYCGVFQYITEFKISKWSLVSFSAIYLSFPILTEKFIYQLDVIAIMVSYCAGALALLYAFKAVEQKQRKYIPVTIALLVVTEASYESFLFLFVMGVFAIFILRITVNDQKLGFKHIFFNGFKYALILLLSMVFYYTLVFVVQKLTSQFGLMSRKSGFINALPYDLVPYLKDIVNKLNTLLRHSPNFAIREFFIVSQIGIIFFTLISIKRKNIAIIFCFVAMFLSNFILGFFVGAFSLRTFQTMCFFIAFIILLIVDTFSEKVFIKRLIICGVVLLTISQAASMNRSFYNDYVRYQKEVLFIDGVAKDLLKCDISKPVVFSSSGKSMLEYLNSNLYDGKEVNGNSAILWCDYAFYPEQKLMYSEFFRLNGYEFICAPSLAQAKEGHERAKDMPCWPHDGYIQEFDDFIVANIG